MIKLKKHLTLWLLELIKKTKILTKSKLMSQWVRNMNLNQKKVQHQVNIELMRLIKRPNIKQELHIFVEKSILKEDQKRIILVLDTTMVTLLNLEEISLIKWISDKNINFNQKKVQHQVNIDQMTRLIK